METSTLAIAVAVLVAALAAAVAWMSGAPAAPRQGNQHCRFVPTTPPESRADRRCELRCRPYWGGDENEVVRATNLSCPDPTFHCDWHNDGRYECLGLVGSFGDRAAGTPAVARGGGDEE